MIIQGNIIDIESRTIFTGIIEVESGKIKSITKNNKSYSNYILPGFIDAHVHIESSMLMPTAFAQEAVKHGTIATISDPHEIANVLGIRGVEFYIENSKKTPFNIFFGVPSCVPATSFETAGAIINSDETKTLLENPDIWYLAEMMNFPGVIFNDEEVHKKIKHAHAANKPVDGHAPGLRGEQMQQYFNAGITTDHECFTYDEGKDKAKHGVNILIREGSAAKNYEALIPLIKEFPKQIMFCSDDKHPDDLLVGHINKLVARAVADGYDLFDVLHAACIAPIKHYKIPVGALQVGDIADFIIVSNLTDFDVEANYIKGELVAENGVSKIEIAETTLPNNFNCHAKNENDFVLNLNSQNIKVIEAHDGQLITTSLNGYSKSSAVFESDFENDFLQIAVINRYSNAQVANAIIKGFGLKKGAIASTVAHDSHNIICVGTNHNAMCKAVNALVENKGGISVYDETELDILALPIAGLISEHNAEYVAKKYSTLSAKAKQLGSQLQSPFMTLSFMALLVIPEIKLSDKGLFDGKKFEFISVS